MIRSGETGHIIACMLVSGMAWYHRICMKAAPGLRLPVSTAILACLLLIPRSSMASTTGALSGVVSDQDGTPIVGASVMVDGTQFGAMTNGSGEYYIARLAPGTYSITARMVGMSPVTMQGVSIVSDQTTTLDVELSAEAVGTTVVLVTGQRNLILEDVPSTIHVVDRSEIRTMPVASVLDVIQRQAGISTQGGEIHVRGGRAGEVAFLLDGVSMRSPVTNAFVSSVPLSAIAEASTTTGGFGADYGNAMSGIVNMAVREGGSRYEGEADFGSGAMTVFGAETEGRNYTSSSENDGFRSDCLDGEFSLGGPEPVTSFLLPAIGLQIPGEMRFFGACEWVRSGFDLEDSRGNWDNNWQNLASGCLNLTYRPDPLTTFSCLGRYSYRQGGWDEWAWSRYDQPAYVEGEPYLGGSTDNALPIKFDENWGITSRASRMVGDNTFLDLMFDRSQFCAWQRIRDIGGGYVGDDLTPAAWYAEYFPERVADSLGFYHAGIHPNAWLESRSSVSTVKLGLTQRFGRMLEVRTGLEGNYYDIYELSVFANGPGQTHVSNWRAWPSSGAVFLQTSADFSGGMVLNSGIRVDAFNANTEMVSPGQTGATDVPVKWQFSPRFGITHPISDRDVFFATYGHYFQMPDLNQMFCGTNYNLSGNYSIVGNPDLDAVRTTSYEAGVRHRLDDLSTLSLAAFYKQIAGLVQTTPTAGGGSQFFFMYENDDSYATVQGAELTVARLPGDLLSGSVTYTYSVATGRYSSATEQYEYSSQGLSVISEEENYLDWDQRHSANAHLALCTEKGQGPETGGMHLFESSTLTLDWSWGSGFPFNPPSNDSLPEINTERYPWTMQTDVSASRKIWTGGLEMEARVTVYNIFDRKNLVRIFDPGIYLDSGEPGGLMENPAAYSPARHVLFGVDLRW